MEGAEGCPVAGRVREIVRRHGDRTAVCAPDGELSYTGLWERAVEWRQRCEAAGLPAGALVCVVSDGNAELPAVFLGLRAAGLVPLLVDALLPAAHVESVIGRAKPAAVVTCPGGEIRPVFPAAERRLPPEAGYVTFSSGSQGAPKAIVGQARGLLRFVDWEAAEVGGGPGTRTAMLTSPSFDVVFRDLLLPLCTGGELHIAGSAIRTSPGRVLAWLAAHEIEVLHAVPSLATRWADAAPSARVAGLRATLLAGEPLHDRHVTRWRSVAPSTRVFNLYGPSETTLAKFCHEVAADPPPGVQPVGRPLPGTTFTLEPVAGEPAARRVVISSPDGSLGYLAGTCGPADERRLTRESGVTRFATQDRGEPDGDGGLVIGGRLDTLVKRNGTLVDIARIETAAAALPDLRTACCVQLVPSGRIVLAVECADPAEAGQVRRRLRPRLGMELPDEVRVLPALPLLPGGKVDRRTVRSLLEGEEAVA
ncbi:AMP-binding protein [Amycolatopsis sp. NPDC005003]